MHRSGTSALARLLALLGVDLGEKLLDAQEGVNARGFWENAELVRINESILSALGHHWYDFGSLPDQWWRNPVLDTCYREAISFMQNEFGKATLVALKDPRLSLLLPFWKNVAIQSGWRPMVILAVRAPWEVSASLCKRDPLDESSALLLWLRYCHDAMVHSAAYPRILIDYRHLLADWRKIADRVSSTFSLDWPAPSESLAARLDAEIDPALRHQNETFTRPDRPLNVLVRDIYAQMRTVAASDWPDIDARHWQMFERMLADCPAFVDGLAKTNSRLFYSVQRLHDLGVEHEKAVATIAQRDAQLQESNRKLQRKGQAHALAIATVTERDAQLLESNEQLQRLGDEHAQALKVIERRDCQLREVQQQLQEVGNEHGRALQVIEERDRQLESVNRQLADLGQEHARALAVIQERDQELQRLNRSLEELGAAHARAIDTVNQRDVQLRQAHQQLLEKGEAHGHAISVVEERDRQLQDARRVIGEQERRLSELRQQREETRLELEYATGIVQERDAQLQKIAGELDYAVGIVQERDAQLQKIAGELDYAVGVVRERDESLRMLQVRLDRLYSHPLMRRMIHLFSLDKE